MKKGLPSHLVGQFEVNAGTSRFSPSLVPSISSSFFRYHPLHVNDE